MRIRFLCLVLLAVSMSAPATADLRPPDSVVQFSVECEGIPSRGVEAQIYLADVPPIGTIVFSTGGLGRAPYTVRAERARTVDEMLGLGYDIYVIVFTDEMGWQEGAAGFGLSAGPCAYAEAVLWVAANAANADVLCIQGNSAASSLIAYGLQDHGLDGVVDLALPTGGPGGTIPIEMCEGTFGNPSDETLREVDFAMGWPIGTCTGESPLTQEQRDALLTMGLAYHEDQIFQTKIRMMMGSLDKNKAYSAAWMDTMRKPPTQVSQQIVAGIDHKFDKDPLGAELIRRVLRAHCRN